MDEKINWLLNKIENKELVLPEFQREFTWNKTQSKELIESFLKDYPTGALLFWKTKEKIALKNMKDFKYHNRIDVILDGQQRLTTLYLLIKDSIPPYYSEKDIGKRKNVRNLYYNLETGKLEYYKKLKMKNNPIWVKVTDCFKNNEIDVFEIAKKITENKENNDAAYNKSKLLSKHLDKIKSIKEKHYPIIYVKESSTLREALIVFDRVNSAGTPLSEADIALAHMCSRWADTRREFKTKLKEMKKAGFDFDLTFLVRGMNAVINHRAEYKQLHKNEEKELIQGFEKLTIILDYLINILKNRAYIYNSDDLNTHNVLIPIIGYLSIYGPEFSSDKELKKALYWMYAALYRRRFTSSVDQKLEEDLKALKKEYTPDVPPLNDLIDILKEDTGDPKVSPANIASRTVNHPFYNMMNIVIRANGGVDWSNGINLAEPFGKKYNIERHHIFPKSILSEFGYDTNKLHEQRLVHEIANRTPLTKSSNMEIFNKKPVKYLNTIKNKNPGNLEKFFIPMNENLWKLENYELFLEKRRSLIAQGINDFMRELISEFKYEIKRKTIPEIINFGESENFEFKSSLLWNLYTKEYDKRLEKPILKTICGFLNKKGGTLLIGVKDNGEIYGIEKDLEKFGNTDKYQLHLTNIISDRIGTNFIPYIKVNFIEQEERKICRIDVNKAHKPSYYKKGNEEKFYVRIGNSTKELTVSEAKEYIDNNWQ